MNKTIIAVLLLMFMVSPIYAEYKIPLDKNKAVVQLAIADAKRDVQRYIPTYGMGAGCFLGPLGLLITSYYQPIVPVDKLIGRSADYVYAYAEVYRTEARHLEFESALGGCILNSFPTVGLAVVGYFLITE